MARAKAPRPLKVFTAELGFVRGIVAAHSQKAALEALGVSRNLFAEGLARLEDDAALMAEARARPGEVIRKPLSDAAGYVAAAKAPPQADVEQRPAAKPKPVDRSRLDAAEAAIAAEEGQLAAQLVAIAEERAHLDDQEQRTKLAAEKRLTKLRAERNSAKADLRAVQD